MKRRNVSVIIFYDNVGNILLHERTPNVWELVGGGVEQNEDPKQTIIREISEELHYQLNELADELILVSDSEISNEKFLGKIHCFKARFPGLEKFSDSEETLVKNLKLFSPQEASKKNLLPVSKEMLSRFF